MIKKIKIHIFGASGSGVTTLGKNLSQHYRIPSLDADDYYWKETNPPFQEANPIEARKILLKNAISSHSSWVVSGSLISWGDTIQNEFSCAIYLYVPMHERIQRIKNRERKRFGERIEVGGDMYEGHSKFLEWAKQYDEGLLSGRSKPRHEAWMKTLKCPLLKIEGIFNEADLLSKTITYINELNL
ncbi:MAG: AAA family ATPase [Bacteriovorax sp.]